MSALPAIVLALAVVSVGCEQPAALEHDSLTLIEGLTVAPGSLFTVEHQNDSHVTFGVTECGREIETLVNEAWARVAEEPRICPAALRTIHHGERVSFRLDVPSDIPDGRYRFRLRAYALSAAVDPRVLDIVSAPFNVRR